MSAPTDEIASSNGKYNESGIIVLLSVIFILQIRGIRIQVAFANQSWRVPMARLLANEMAHQKEYSHGFPNCDAILLTRSVLLLFHQVNALEHEPEARSRLELAQAWSSRYLEWNVAEKNFPFAVHILDLYHALVHLETLAKDLYGENAASIALAKIRWRDWLDADQVQSVIDETTLLANTLSDPN